ncbi:succinate dehydrogenase (quinone) flavoprotein subunit [Rhabdochromatium marinum]|uniref:succinate dehydrogenase (quinone) flavoprotein subunit n=1 Tax=Rhabdochromatium marinum TaxID=48729 RepID=UPI0019090409|nr:succinate dehydrogenase (quinone) flavoprotein subunit [Rhabdochromatium marinum]MBK1649849.1 succinate dehydrogenase flavoprotein subunit [Rhabdochromatium marinum]
MSARSVIVVGGGLAGLLASLRIATAGHQVQLFSLFEVMRSHSVCAQGGINAALDTKGEGDSIEQHIVDTLKGGSYLANQPPVKSLCEEAPGLINSFERMGVAFSRTPEGGLDQRLFGGVKNKRTCFAGASTGQQLLYSLDQQVRRLEVEKKIEKLEWWEFLAIVKDPQGRCRGIVAMNLRSLEVRAFRADAVVLATGGFGQIYSPKTTCSTNSTGAAASRVFQQGARFANAEFFQFHPTAMIGDDKTRLMSEAARGEGGRIWVPRQAHDRREPLSIPEAERFYFLEDWYPSYGNTVPRDIASRAIWKVTRELELGVGGQDQVYLDLTHLDPKQVETRLGAILSIYRKFSGVDPINTPMRIFPAAHYAMGGLWVDFEKDPTTGGLRANSPRNHATSIPGLYACGECDYAYHGANRLGANSLLSAAFSGRVAGEAVTAYVSGLEQSVSTDAQGAFDAEIRYQNQINHHFIHANGNENPYELHQRLGALMTDAVGVIRENALIDEAFDELVRLEQAFARLKLGEANPWANQTLAYARQVFDMVKLAQVVTASAHARDECRGAHHKPAFEDLPPKHSKTGDEDFEIYRERWKANNKKWLRTTIADYHQDGPRIGYEPVDTSLVAADQPRDYR